MKIDTSDLISSYKNAVNAFKLTLPRKQRDNWQDLKPLDGIVALPDDEDFELFKARWESFLDSLDKLWNRMNAFSKHHIKDEDIKQRILGYLGNVNDVRTSDELLVYLDKARNNAQHTLWRHLRSSQKREVILDGEGAEIEIKNDKPLLKIKEGGKFSEAIVLEEGVILLKEVKLVDQNTGESKIYNLPNYHKGTALYTLDKFLPHMVGKIGLTYYKETLDEYIKRINSKSSIS